MFYANCTLQIPFPRPETANMYPGNPMCRRTVCQCANTVRFLQ